MMAAKSALGGQGTSGNNILIVESYLAGAEVFATILKRNGFTADIAQTRKEAIEMICSTDYSIAIIDEEIIGSELVLQKLANTNTMRILITDFSPKVTLNVADVYLTKIVKPEELLFFVTEFMKNNAKRWKDSHIKK